MGGRFESSEETKDEIGSLPSWSCRLNASGAGLAPELGTAATSTEARIAAVRNHGRAKRWCLGILSVGSVGCWARVFWINLLTCCGLSCRECDSFIVVGIDVVGLTTEGGVSCRGSWAPGGGSGETAICGIQKIDILRQRRTSTGQCWCGSAHAGWLGNDGVWGCRRCNSFVSASADILALWTCRLSSSSSSSSSSPLTCIIHRYIDGEQPIP